MAITTFDVDQAPEAVLRVWWASLPTRTDEERDVAERMAIRAEGCGMIENVGGVGRLR